MSTAYDDTMNYGDSGWCQNIHYSCIWNNWKTYLRSRDWQHADASFHNLGRNNSYSHELALNGYGTWCFFTALSAALTPSRLDLLVSTDNIQHSLANSEEIRLSIISYLYLKKQCKSAIKK